MNNDKHQDTNQTRIWQSPEITTLPIRNTEQLQPPNQGQQS
ncbi:hypothetical protein [Rhodohalobacter sp. 614A]|nr:hypothetical protein [Rhodohalobacter sp. 614A]